MMPGEPNVLLVNGVVDRLLGGEYIFGKGLDKKASDQLVDLCRSLSLEHADCNDDTFHNIKYPMSPYE